MKKILRRGIFWIARRCSRTNPFRQFLRRAYIRFKTNKQVIDQEAARKNLVDTINVLNALQVKWFIDGGTCLGAMREKTFIPYDFDIDFGVMGNHVDLHEELLQRMKEKGFVKIDARCGGTAEFGLAVGFMRDNIGVDIAYYYEIGDRCFQAVWPSWGMLKHAFDRTLFTPLKEMEFVGTRVFVPNNPEAFCEARFGADWRTPKRDWDWQVDTKCRVELVETHENH